MKLLGFSFLLAWVSITCINEGSWQSFGFQIQISQRPLRKRGFDDRNIYNQQQHHPTTTATTRTCLHSYSHDLPRVWSSSSKTALCIIPPDDFWDTLQRARHFAQDKTYSQWPPAIRLFHPFCPRSKLTNVALDLATVVKKYDIQPFSITLNQWTVMPLMPLPEMFEQEELAQADDDSPPLTISPEEEAVNQLIADEERKGKERKRQRLLRLQRKAQQEGWEMEAANATTQSAATLVEEEQEQQQEEEPEQHASEEDEFNGPAMIALEPDEKSIRKLKQLRELLRQELQKEFDSSPAANDIWDSPVPLCDDHQLEDFHAMVDDITSFRPLIPMGEFPTIDIALKTARKLKGLWDPLTFDVTDLHFISQASPAQQHLLEEEQQSSPELQHTSAIHKKKDSQVPFGCDALVMLMGEEIEQDEQANDIMAQKLWEEGTPGGHGRQGNKDENDETLAEEIDDFEGDSHKWMFDDFERKLDVKEGDWEDLMDWLDGDEDEEELEIGTTVVIGRTHMFSGESRAYAGMPASSIVEEERSTFGMGSGSLGSDSLLWNDVDYQLGQSGFQPEA